MKNAIVIVGHGSNLPFNAEVLKYLKEILEQDDTFQNFRIEIGFVQINSPSLSAVLERLIEEGYQKIIIALVFISRGVHTEKDIKEIVTNVKKKAGDVEISITEPIGKDIRLVEIIKNRIHERIETNFQ